jgi:hypothetical protein
MSNVKIATIIGASLIATGAPQFELGTKGRTTDGKLVEYVIAGADVPKDFKVKVSDAFVATVDESAPVGIAAYTIPAGQYGFIFLIENFGVMP